MGARAVRSLVLLSMSLLTALTMAACGGRLAPIQSPVTVSAGQTYEQTEYAVRDVLARRHWTVEQQQPGRMVAYLIVRSHRLRVDIRYDPQHVNVYYLDSENLKARAEPDGVYAHPKVNVWMSNLASDIARALAVSSQAPSSGGSAPPPPGPAQYPPAGQPQPQPDQPGQPANPTPSAPLSTQQPATAPSAPLSTQQPATAPSAPLSGVH